jgi:hypothetical protein
MTTVGMEPPYLEMYTFSNFNPFLVPAVGVDNRSEYITRSHQNRADEIRRMEELHDVSPDILLDLTLAHLDQHQGKCTAGVIFGKHNDDCDSVLSEGGHGTTNIGVEDGAIVGGRWEEVREPLVEEVREPLVLVEEPVVTVNQPPSGAVHHGFGIDESTLKKRNNIAINKIECGEVEHLPPRVGTSRT